ncbi:uncharacterized protein LOC103315445 [Nasonia vitripennis]|uniref:Uncharacterized protein n=1 Tax=Nasonia vitripennis TaxID=7425 RepID=A0A7M7QEY0_NASVI|nr:uncharacterized protein LOC103315445 [Nasonia vitripennis]
MPKLNKVRLHGDYDVMIGRRKFDDILRLNKNKPKNIIRELAKELIGEQKLATLSETAIDEDIVKDIVGFTNLNTNRSNRMSMTQVKRCITLYCGFCKTKLSGKTKLDSGLKSASQDNHKKEKSRIKSIKNHTQKVKIIPSTSAESEVLGDVYDDTQDLNEDILMKSLLAI